MKEKYVKKAVKEETKAGSLSSTLSTPLALPKSLRSISAKTPARKVGAVTRAPKARRATTEDDDGEQLEPLEIRIFEFSGKVLYPTVSEGKGAAVRLVRLLAELSKPNVPPAIVVTRLAVLSFHRVLSGASQQSDEVIGNNDMRLVSLSFRQF
jgi:hypothetical protein